MARGRHSAPRRVRVSPGSAVQTITLLVWAGFGVWGYRWGDITWWLWAAWLEIGVIAIVTAVLYRDKDASGLKT